MKSSKLLGMGLALLLSPSAFSDPHFKVFHEGNSLFVSFKHKQLVQRVTKEVSDLYADAHIERVVVLNTEPEGVMLQFFEFFGAENVADEVVAKVAEIVEQRLEHAIIGHAVEVEYRPIVRVPWAPTEEEIQTRRADYVRNVVDMTRHPSNFFAHEMLDIGIEGVDLPYMMAQREAVEKRRRVAEQEGRPLTRMDIDEMVNEQNTIALMRERALESAVEEKYRVLLSMNAAVVSMIRSISH